jgi:hypothetical protein
MRVLFTFLVLLLLNTWTLADAGYTNSNAAKICIQSSNGSDNYQNMDNISSFGGGAPKTSSSYFHLKDAEAWVYKNNSSNITGVTFNYRVYIDGTSAPSFSSINFDYQEENGTDTKYQRWGKYGFDIDLLNGLAGGQTYRFECYYSSSTNGINCSNPIYLNVGGSNYSFTFTTDATLPIELSSFNIQTIDSGIKLNWKTATEINNYGFSVQRSSDNANWETLSFVKGAGNSNAPRDYSYIDKNVANGDYFYRLRQQDNDGSYKFYDAKEVTVALTIKFGLQQNYPNPFNPSTKISYSIEKPGNVRLTVYNAIGQMVKSFSNSYSAPGTYSVTFDGASLASGMYFYKIESNGFTATRKMLLMK